MGVAIQDHIRFIGGDSARKQARIRSDAQAAILSTGMFPFTCSCGLSFTYPNTSIMAQYWYFLLVVLGAAQEQVRNDLNKKLSLLLERCAAGSGSNQYTISCMKLLIKWRRSRKNNCSAILSAGSPICADGSQYGNEPEGHDVWNKGMVDVESTRRQILREVMEAIAQQTNSPYNEFSYRLDVQVHTPWIHPGEIG